MLNRMRMAGDYLRNVDQRYGEGLAELITGKAGSRMSKNPVLGTAQGLAAVVAGAPVSQKFAVEGGNQALQNLMGYGIPAAAAGVRYGLPAAGLMATANAIGNGYDALQDVPVLG